MVQIKNYMEDCVLDLMNPVINEMKVCKCEKCKYDIMAIALNQVKPKYVVTKKGSMYTKIEMLQNQFNVDLIATITQAVEIVSKNPRHDA